MNDFEFLTSQYIVNANDGNIHYQKFLDDIRSISGRYQTKMLDSKMSIGFNRTASGGPQSRVAEACEAIIKKFYILQMTPEQGLMQWNRYGNGMLDSNLFTDILMNNLQLSPEFNVAEL